MRAFDVSTSTTATGAAVLSLHGELDIDSSGRVEQELRWMERQAPPSIILDLRGLSFIDSTGLRLVAAADTRARSAGRAFSIVGGSDSVQRVFKITAMDKRLNFVDAESVGL